MTSKEYWNKLAACGWLDYIPAKKQREVREQLAKNLEKGTRYACFSLTSVAFDTECIYEEGDYRTILKDLAAASLGSFQPKNIKVHFDDALGIAEISFKHTRKTFSCEIPFTTDWMDMQVLDLVNQALAFGQSPARFIPLPSEDQLLFLVFVPPSVYEKAAKAKLVPKNVRFLRKLAMPPTNDKKDGVNKKNVAALKSSDWDTRHLAVMELGETRAKAKAAFAHLQEATRDPHPCVRESAADALPRVGPAAVPSLEALLDDSDGIVRVKAACNLLRIQEHKAAIALLKIELRPDRKARKGRDARVKDNALYDLAEMGDVAAPALPAILLALDDPSTEVRSSAFEVLRILGPLALPALPQLVKLLKSKDKSVRGDAAYTLGSLGPAAAKAVPGSSRS